MKPTADRYSYVPDPGFWTGAALFLALLAALTVRAFVLY